MASSTKIPMTNVKASRVIMFKLKPIQLITAKVGMREIGIAAAAISVARQFRKNKNTTMAASNIPSIKALKVAHITEKLDLTEKEAQQFWPIYNAYDEKMGTLKQTQKDRNRCMRARLLGTLLKQTKEYLEQTNNLGRCNIVWVNL